VTDVQTDPANFNATQPSWWAWKGDESNAFGSDVVAVVEAVWEGTHDPFGKKHLFITHTIATAFIAGDEKTSQLTENRRELVEALTLEEFRALVRGGVFQRIG
jgi:hypothetical protein